MSDKPIQNPAGGAPIDESINQLPDPSTFFSDGKTRAKPKIRSAGADSALSITSLMDALTILLVFLLMNFAADPTRITQNDALQLVQSTETLALERAVPVAITATHIMVSEAPVVAVQNGRVDGTFKRNGDDGYYIIPLAERLQDEADKQKSLARVLGERFAFKGRLILVADRRTPFRLLTEVMYTAGQAEFGDFMFAVIGD